MRFRCVEYHGGGSGDDAEGSFGEDCGEDCLWRVGSLVARLREMKDAEEMKRIRKAALLGCRLFDGMLEFLQPGMTEIAVAAELEYRRAAGRRGSNVV